MTCSCGHDRKRRPCGCGCCPEDEVVCTLDCPTRPVFHCGQLLTEGHLSQLTRWVDDRLALGRFRHGWGVVCGLEVCADPAAGNRVIVGEGYVVDCCGRDLVLCKPACLDLAKACKPGGDCAAPGADGNDEAACEIAGLTFRDRELCVVDLLLEPDEAPACVDPGDRRQPTAVRETARVIWRAADRAAPQPGPFAAAWQACADAVRQLAGEGPAAGLEGLARRLEHQPPCHFRWLAAAVQQARGNPDLNEPAVAALLFWWLVDCRLRLLACACAACEPEDRVRLARVWLGIDGEGRWRVVHIDDRPPHRRELHLDCDTCDGVELNVARLAFWRPPAEAAARLAAAGFTRWREHPVRDQDRLSGMLELLPCERPPAQLELLVIDEPCFGIGTRVVGWGVRPPARR